MALEEYSKNSAKASCSKYLDKSCQLYFDLDIDTLMDALYCEKGTDINATVYCNKNVCVSVNRFFMETYTCDTLYQALGAIQSYIQNNNKVMTKSLVDHVDIKKTWLDELYIDIVHLDSTVDSYFINMGLFHLYSPSVISEGAELMLKPSPM